MRKRVLPQGGKLVRVAGTPVRFEVERHIDQKKIDHVWLHVKARDHGTIRISLNTWSLKSFESGYDPRIRIAVVTSRWRKLPALGIFPSNGLDYAVFRQQTPTAFLSTNGWRSNNSLHQTSNAQPWSKPGVKFICAATVVFTKCIAEERAPSSLQITSVVTVRFVSITTKAGRPNCCFSNFSGNRSEIALLTYRNKKTLVRC